MVSCKIRTSFFFHRIGCISRFVSFAFLFCVFIVCLRFFYSFANVVCYCCCMYFYLLLHRLNLNKFICRSCKKGPLKNKSNKYLWKCAGIGRRKREQHGTKLKQRQLNARTKNDTQNIVYHYIICWNCKFIAVVLPLWFCSLGSVPLTL